MNSSSNLFSTNVTDYFEKTNTTINNSDNITVFTSAVASINEHPIKEPINENNAREVTSTWRVEEGQSTFDIVAQFYPSSDYLETFLKDNDLTYDSSLSSGQIVKLRPELVLLSKDNRPINNADYIERVTGPLRIILISVGNEINGSDGYAIVDVLGGTLPYTFLWSNGQTTQNLNAVVAGTYTLTVTDNDMTVAILIVQIITIIDYSYLIDENSDYVIDEFGDFIVI